MEAAIQRYKRANGNPGADADGDPVGEADGDSWESQHDQMLTWNSRQYCVVFVPVRVTRKLPPTVINIARKLY